MKPPQYFNLKNSRKPCSHSLRLCFGGKRAVFPYEIRAASSVAQ